MKQSVDVDYMQLIDHVVEFISVLLILCLLNLFISHRKVVRSPMIMEESLLSPCSTIAFV